METIKLPWYYAWNPVKISDAIIEIGKIFKPAKWGIKLFTVTDYRKAMIEYKLYEA